MNHLRSQKLLTFKTTYVITKYGYDCWKFKCIKLWIPKNPYFLRNERNHDFDISSSPLQKRRENGEESKWQLWQKWQPEQPRQLVHMDCKVWKKGDFNEKSQIWIKSVQKLHFLRRLFNKIWIFWTFCILFQIWGKSVGWFGRDREALAHGGFRVL